MNTLTPRIWRKPQKTPNKKGAPNGAPLNGFIIKALRLFFFPFPSRKFFLDG